MKLKRSFLFPTAIAAALLSGHSAHAADGVWTGATNDWQTTSNWIPDTLPGSTTSGSFASTETATFSSTGSGTINLGDFINIRTILFGVAGGNAGPFTIGDANDTLNLSNSGAINLTGGVSGNQSVGVAGTLIGLTSVNAGAAGSFINNSQGTLTVAGAVSNVTVSGNTPTTVVLGGIGNGTVTGALSSSGTLDSAGLKLTKTGSGTWTLTGANSFTGGITIGGASSNSVGGTLVLDYGINSTVVGATNPLLFGGGLYAGGSLYIKGNGAGTTAQSLGNLTLGISSGQNSLVVDNNGGAGTTLTVANSWNRNTGGYLLMDLSSGGAITSSPGLTNGVLVGGAAAAAFFVKTATVTDFATVSGGSIAPLNAPDGALVSGDTSTTKNTSLSSSLILGANTSTGTLRVDTTAGNGGVLDLGSNTLTPGKSNILFDGTGSYMVDGITTGGLTSIIFSHFSTGTVTVNCRVNTAFTKVGPGLVVGNFNTQLVGAAGSGLSVLNGVFRAANANSLPTTGPLNLNSGGILELTAASGDITKAIGIGTTQVNFLGSGGFSAFDSDRVVALGGTVSPPTLNWASSAAFLRDGAKLILGSAYSGFTLDFRNPINLNGSQRVVEVHDGTSSTNVDGLLNGVISGTGNSGLTKTGTGTLGLANANTYAGATVVAAGKLLINNPTGSATGTGAVTVASGATLGGSGTISNTATLNNGAKLAFNLSTNAAGHDKLDLGGLVNSGTTTVVISSSGGASPGTYVLATAAGGVSGAGSINPAPVLPSGWSGTVAVVGNNVELTLNSTGGGSTPYDTWAAGPFANPFTNTAPGVDFDNDGFENLMEFVLGGDPTISQPGVAPTVAASGTNLVITFKRSDASELQPVAVKVQVSDDLAIWDPASDIPIGPASNPGPIGAGLASYTLTNSGGFDTVIVTIPKGAAAKKFARVVATD